MKKKFSRYLEDKDKVILKRERRVILSEGVDGEENKDNEEIEEEEEYWDYEDGGQPLEELDYLEKLDQTMEKLKQTFHIVKPKTIYFNLWKQKTIESKSISDDIGKQKQNLIEVEVSPSLTKKDLNEIKPNELVVEDAEKTPREKIGKINIIDKMTAAQNLGLLNQDYILDLNKKLRNKIECPKMIPYSSMKEFFEKSQQRVLAEQITIPLITDKLK